MYIIENIAGISGGLRVLLNSERFFRCHFFTIAARDRLILLISGVLFLGTFWLKLNHTCTRKGGISFSQHFRADSTIFCLKVSNAWGAFGCLVTLNNRVSSIPSTPALCEIKKLGLSSCMGSLLSGRSLQLVLNSSKWIASSFLSLFRLLNILPL